MSLKNLQKLDLYGLLIGEQQIQHLKELQLPSLRELMLYQNELNTQSLKKWLTKINFPKIENLNVNLNYLDSNFFLHIAQQNFQLKELSSKIIQINKKALNQLAKINMSKMQKLTFNFATVTPVITQNFFLNTDLSSIKYFDFRMLTNAGNIFRMILQKFLPQIQQLFLPEIGIINEDDFQKQNIFPKLKQIQIVDLYNRITVQKLFFQNIYKLAPNIEKIVYNLSHDMTLIAEIVTNSIIIQTNRPLRIILRKKSTLQKQLQNSQQIIEILYLPNQKPQIIKINFQYVFAIMFMKAEAEAQAKGEKVKQFSINTLIGQLSNNFNLTFLNTVSGDSGMKIIFTLISKMNLQCNFPNLTSIITSFDILKLKMIKKCYFPSLSSIYFKPRMAFQGDDILKYPEQEQEEQEQKQTKKQEDQYQEQYKDYSYSYFPYLQQIDFSGWKNWSQVQKFFSKKYTYLKNLNVKGLNLEYEQFKIIMQSIPYLSKIRKLTVDANKFNKGFQMIGDSFTALKQLSLNMIVFNSNVFKNNACLINFQFMETLAFVRDGISDADFVQWIQCVKNKSQGKKLAFPKLTRVSFMDNSIETKGFQTLMQQQLPLFQSINFKNNKDPEIFNSLFSYPSSRRLSSFSTINNYFSGIDPNIDPKNTRKMQTFLIRGSSVRSTDMKALSKLQYPSLISTTLLLENLQSCSDLKAILKMCLKITFLNLEIMDSQQLNSTCIDRSISTEYMTSQIYIALADPSSEVRNFAEYFFAPGQSLSFVSLIGVYISDAKLLQIARTSNLNQIQELILMENDIGDIAIKQILSVSRNELKILALNRNQRITSEAFRKMKNFKFQKLYVFDISRTSLNNTGLQYLVTNEFPSLAEFHLQNTNIDGEGLTILSSLKAPELQILDISCNNFTKDQIAKLSIVNFPKLQLIIVYPMLTEQQEAALMKKWKDESHAVQIKSDIIRQENSKLYIQTFDL